ncbi:hypothetical protein Z517_04976 [Fonsecaea pedrosoi CBS 271.37]|uniref:Unplaced genomic scaffold supercont1.3, whole genome shotgun sequence n=1 Tax=Fonsecaea pedrosoi CBS 271.37 TaxID=1442368 RepID=A0A0D2GTS8_9EURO|nr:uncharacterized protein Z517_04976 [Fonsecaea pedrosoi CBS 271.37]KIW81950.1 hypothetical protein Z517_04976 [Fonsecaea pedrosoi CBS 271.37]
MAPRRSTARGSSATPVRAVSPAKRSTRAGSAASPDNAIPRRVTRGTSQQPSLAADGIVNNPRLPEVQLQQSYAYGSSKTPVLPTQLLARSRMNLTEMAETIDVGVEQAQQHLQNHIEETQANLQKDPRAERARRRASRENSREASVASDDAEKHRTQRVAAWASSLDDNRLNGIPEESQESVRLEAENDDGSYESASRSIPDDDSNKGTDPSSFPSGIFDHSYNYERGLRKPQITIRERKDPWFRKAWNGSKHSAQELRQRSSDFFHLILDWWIRLWRASGRAIRSILNSPLVAISMSIFFALVFVGGASFLLCHTYTNFVCDPLSTSSAGLTLQKFCGRCTRSPSIESLNLTAGNRNDLSKLTAAIQNINQQLGILETRLTDKLDSQYATVGKDIESLKRQYSELSNQMGGLRPGDESGTLPGNVPSPIIRKVNYFAPSNGAMIDLKLTSPTMQKPRPFLHRLLLRILLSAHYVTKPPLEALTPWHDVGDCWCAAAVEGSDPGPEDDLMRLGVTVTEMIYPTEVLLENYPSTGSLLPGSTPKTIELWADFEHLDSLEWEKLNIRSMQGVTGSPLGPTYALIGKMEYDVSNEASYTQAFPLDVNQGSLAYPAQNFVVRVTENYGAEFACLYRVRLHGVPLSGTRSSADSTS